MDKEQLEDVFLKRIYIEYELFKDSMFHKAKTDIFEESCRIELYKNLYPILIQKASEMAETVLRRLVYQSYGIIEFFYQEWLKKEDSGYTELREYVSSELEDYYMEAEREMSVGKNAEPEREMSMERNTESERETEKEEETAGGKEGAYGKEHSKAS